MSAVVLALSGSTVSLCSRLCLRIQVQRCMPDSLKTSLALVDHVVQDLHPRIQIRVPDPVCVLCAPLPSPAVAAANGDRGFCKTLEELPSR